jgi:hypothetical protein
MRIRYGVILVILVLPANINLASPTRAMAQQSQIKDDMEQLAMDLHVGVDRSTLTPQQKEQLRDDFRELREAQKNHQMFAALRAARSIRTALDSGAFKPQDRERIKQDMQAIKEAREDHPHGLGGF